MYWLTASSTLLDFSYNDLIYLSVIKMFVSSANSTNFPNCAGLMHIINKRGPSTEPCGTPYSTINLSEFPLVLRHTVFCWTNSYVLMSVHDHVYRIYSVCAVAFMAYGIKGFAKVNKYS